MPQQPSSGEATFRRNTVIHIDKLTIQLSNALYDAEAMASRRNPATSKIILRDVRDAMRALTGPFDIQSQVEQDQQQQPSLQPPVNDESSRLSNRFPSITLQQEVPSPSPVPPRQPTPLIAPEALSGIF